MLRIVTVIVMSALLVFGRGPLAAEATGESDVAMMMILGHGQAGEHSCPMSERGPIHNCCSGLSDAAVFPDTHAVSKLHGVSAAFFSRSEVLPRTVMAECDPPIPKLVA